MIAVSEIPDQLSNDPAYPGYRNDWVDIGSQVQILLDGVEQSNACAYDRIGGVVTRARTDDRGCFVFEFDNFVIEHVTGLVEVRPLQQ